MNEESPHPVLLWFAHTPQRVVDCTAWSFEHSLHELGSFRRRHGILALLLPIYDPWVQAGAGRIFLVSCSAPVIAGHSDLS